jgi:hypothetical protein
LALHARRGATNFNPTDPFYVDRASLLGDADGDGKVDAIAVNS